MFTLMDNIILQINGKKWRDNSGIQQIHEDPSQVRDEFSFLFVTSNMV